MTSVNNKLVYHSYLGLFTSGQKQILHKRNYEISSHVFCVTVVCEDCWEVTKMDKMTLLQKNVLC